MTKKETGHSRGRGYVCSPDIGFVQIPNLRGLYMKVHLSVIFCKCHYCDSEPGILCIGSAGAYVASTHAVRRDSWKKEKKKYTLSKAIVIR